MKQIKISECGCGGKGSDLLDFIEVKNRQYVSVNIIFLVFSFFLTKQFETIEQFPFKIYIILMN